MARIVHITLKSSAARFGLSGRIKCNVMPRAMLLAAVPTLLWRSAQERRQKWAVHSSGHIAV